MTKVVVHVDEVAKVNLAIGNVKNLLTAFPTCEVIVVVNGPAITTLVTDVWTALLTTFPQVEVDACQHALDSHQILPSALPAGVTVVPAGVVRIVTLETQGYGYLKP